MPVRTVDELVAKMNALMDRWHQGTRPGNDGEAGNTLEDLLGVAENNFRLPDFGDVEIKTQKFEGSDSLLTLFHKEPQPGASVPKLLKCLGWRHGKVGNGYPADEMSFRSTTYGHRFSDRGLKIEVTNDRLIFVYDPAHVNRSCIDRTAAFPTYGDWADDVSHRTSPHYQTVFPIYYSLQDVAQSFTNKLSHTLLVFRKTRTVNGRKAYRYEEAYLMKDVRTDEIGPLIQEGVLVIDFDARTRHNHGTKFRIKKSHAERLFTEFKAME